MGGKNESWCDEEGRGISHRAAEAVQNSARRSSGTASNLLRAREIAAFRLDRDRTDVRGWQVYSDDAELVGAVASILVDMSSRAVRYLGVRLDDRRSKTSNAEVLVPIGTVSRVGEREVVVAHSLSRAQLFAAPRVSARPVTRADEHAALTSYGMQADTNAGAYELYASPLFDDSGLLVANNERRARAR